MVVAIDIFLVRADYNLRTRVVNICIVETLKIFLVNASSLLLVKGRNISLVEAVDMLLLEAIAKVLVFQSSDPPDILSGPLKE